MEKQLEMSFQSSRLIKEENIKYYEIIGEDGIRSIKKITDTKTHFPKSTGSKHNPTCSNHVEIL